MGKSVQVVTGSRCACGFTVWRSAADAPESELLGAVLAHTGVCRSAREVWKAVVREVR